MFEDLYDALSRLWSFSWPATQAEVTDIELERIGNPDENRIRLCVCYKFWVGDDGPYSGEDFWKPAFTIGQVKRLRDAKKKLNAKRMVSVRYRPADPSINRLDKESWRDL